MNLDNLLDSKVNATHWASNLPSLWLRSMLSRACRLTSESVAVLPCTGSCSFGPGFGAGVLWGFAFGAFLSCDLIMVSSWA